MKVESRKVASLSPSGESVPFEYALPLLGLLITSIGYPWYFSQSGNGDSCLNPTDMYISQDSCLLCKSNILSPFYDADTSPILIILLFSSVVLCVIYTVYFASCYFVKGFNEVGYFGKLLLWGILTSVTTYESAFENASFSFAFWTTAHVIPELYWSLIAICNLFQLVGVKVTFIYEKKTLVWVVLLITYFSSVCAVCYFRLQDLSLFPLAVAYVALITNMVTHAFMSLLFLQYFILPENDEFVRDINSLGVNRVMFITVAFFIHTAGTYLHTMTLVFSPDVSCNDSKDHQILLHVSLCAIAMIVGAKAISQKDPTILSTTPVSRPSGFPEAQV